MQFVASVPQPAQYMQIVTSNKHKKSKDDKMSWDIVLFNSTERIEDFELFDADKLEPIDFNQIFENHFSTILHDGNHREIQGEDYSICYFLEEIPVTNTMLNLYGENGIYEIVYIAKKLGWQIFDTGNGEFIDLENPANNGYTFYQEYLIQILKRQPSNN